MGMSLLFHTICESFNCENPTFSNLLKFSHAKDSRYTVCCLQSGVKIGYNMLSMGPSGVTNMCILSMPLSSCSALFCSFFLSNFFLNLSMKRYCRGQSCQFLENSGLAGRQHRPHEPALFPTWHDNATSYHPTMHTASGNPISGVMYVLF